MEPAGQKPTMSFSDLIKSEHSDLDPAHVPARQPHVRVTLPGMPDKFNLGLRDPVNDSFPIGWLGVVPPGAFSWGYAGLVTDQSAAVALEWHTYMNGQKLLVSCDERHFLNYCLYSSRNNYVGFGYQFDYHEQWSLLGSPPHVKLRCDYNQQLLSLYSEANQYLYAYDPYLVLDVTFDAVQSR